MAVKIMVCCWVPLLGAVYNIYIYIYYIYTYKISYYVSISILVTDLKYEIMILGAARMFISEPVPAGQL